MRSSLAPARPILLMSSERPVRELLRHLLRQEGYSCSAVCDGDEALESIARGRPLVALVDMRRGHEDDHLFLGLLRRRHPDLGAIIVLPGRSLVVCGRSEQVIEHDFGADSPNLPSMEQLRIAIEWIATHTHLSTWKPTPGAA